MADAAAKGKTGLLTKMLVVFVIIGLITAFFALDLGQYLTFDYLKSKQSQFQGYYAANTVQTIALYALIYIASAALSLPGAAILTLAGGALFGVVTGTIIVSFASTIGATLAFLVARFLLRDSIQNKFGDKLQAINDGIKKEGGFYLFGLRLVPVFPFFVINLVMGLTPMRVATFFIVSQIGMLPGTAVYVNAGTQLSKLESLTGILSPSLIGSFVLLGIFPIIAKKALALINARRGGGQGSIA